MSDLSPKTAVMDLKEFEKLSCVVALDNIISQNIRPPTWPS